MPFDGIHVPRLKLTLNAGQQKAIQEILASINRGKDHLLTGHAGSGKTTLIQALAAILTEMRISHTLAAPTHQAVKVLASKFKAAGLSSSCTTLAALLSLTATPDGDRLVFKRRKNAEPVEVRVVIVDECSMPDAELIDIIRRYLKNCVVIYVGDPAQLGPIGEVRSLSFETERRSHLAVIERQGAGNPILDAADIIRQSQGGPMDWSWVRSRNVGGLGVYRPADPDEWLKKAFMSDAFKADSAAFRYAAWTNRRVDEVNRKVRRWIYGGETETPFMAGERVLVREPLIREKVSVLNTCEEVTVQEIKASEFRFEIDDVGDLDGWKVALPSWQMRVSTEDGLEVDVHTVRDERAYVNALERLRTEALIVRHRWKDFHGFKQSLGSFRHLYAMTVHTLQGSTLTNCFMDVHDIRQRAAGNPLECQQLYYVAATRPTEKLILVG